MREIAKQYDVVVVGGGISGVCAALASARGGAHTALLQNRAMLGGNASSEIRVNINGATRNGKIPDVAETGIMMEMLLANKAVNPQNSFDVFGMVLWEMVSKEPNLTLYLNTHFTVATVQDGSIQCVEALQTTSETRFTFAANYFVDTTGDATLAYESGADWTIGREAKATYGEAHAPAVADHHTMGSTVMFSTIDVGHSVPFTRPAWAYEFTKKKLGSRAINMTNHGYWWVELGGDDTRVIEDCENIRDELYKWALGVFDYIKNCGEYDTENLALDWICSNPGRRESRRVLGDYVLNENDVFEGRRFADAVAYGGWTMDDHSVGGINAMGKGEEGTQWLPVPDIYTIPYRSLYSRNIDNLFVGGRACSVSHMALSSTRVIATCGVIGQAIGTAAAIAVANGLSPRAVGQQKLFALQQQLLLDDCYLPGIAVQDATDACQQADCHITASACVHGGEALQLTNGDTRRIKGKENAWIAPLNTMGAWVEAAFDAPIPLAQIDLKFDSNLSLPIQPTLILARVAEQPKEQPIQLVRDFTVQAFLGDATVWQAEVQNNLQRLYTQTLPQDITCDRLRVTIHRTYGDACARMFELRMHTKTPDFSR